MVFFCNFYVACKKLIRMAVIGEKRTACWWCNYYKSDFILFCSREEKQTSSWREKYSQSEIWKTIQMWVHCVFMRIHAYHFLGMKFFLIAVLFQCNIFATPNPWAPKAIVLLFVCQVVLTRLCGCDKLLQSVSMQLAQLQSDKVCHTNRSRTLK